VVSQSVGNLVPNSRSLDIASLSWEVIPEGAENEAAMSGAAGRMVGLGAGGAGVGVGVATGTGTKSDWMRSNGAWSPGDGSIEGGGAAVVAVKGEVALAGTSTLCFPSIGGSIAAGR
jgi:hypothetical protein